VKDAFQQANDTVDRIAAFALLVSLCLLYSYISISPDRCRLIGHQNTTR